MILRDKSTLKQKFINEGTYFWNGYCFYISYINIIFRLKDVAQEQYTQAEAERGMGKTAEIYTPAHKTE